MCYAVLSCSAVSNSLQPLVHSPPGSSIYGILQARVLEWAAMPSSRGSSQSRDRTQISHIAGWFFSPPELRGKAKLMYICICVYVCMCWRRKWQPTPVFMPGKSHGPRSLVGYSPRGRKESDTTEWLLCLCVYVCVLVTQLSPTFCNPVNYSLPGSSVFGILQARGPWSFPGGTVVKNPPANAGDTTDVD